VDVFESRWPVKTAQAIAKVVAQASPPEQPKPHRASIAQDPNMSMNAVASSS
jgi:hypothetical protein